MKNYNVYSMKQLLDVVGAGNPDPCDRGPVVLSVRIWDRRIVSARYYRGPKSGNPDAETKDGLFFDITPLIPLVDKLIKTGESFVVITGRSDDTCTLEWSIADASSIAKPV